MCIITMKGLKNMNILMFSFKLLISLLILNIVILILKLKDKDLCLEYRKENMAFLSMIMIIGCIALEVRFGSKITITSICANLFSVYLVVNAYIDFKTKKIYSILNYIVILLGVLLIFYDNAFNIKIICINLILYFCLLLIEKKLKLFGNGDFEMLIATSLFLINHSFFTTLYLFPLEILLWQILISILIFCTFNFRDVINLILNKSNTKRKAFVPAISIATFLLMLI